ncbi:MAG: hypothetical protein L0Y72_29460 [Gemmataceae bacterium]|nr:hypothetical protein [Gemmataceae bacterium]MCI0743175.1 hypothetical protein [Gemmataceae bacterium]
MRNPSNRALRRCGATAMEYAVVMTLILMAAILVIQHFGASVDQSFANSAKSTNFSDSGSYSGDTGGGSSGVIGGSGKTRDQKGEEEEDKEKTTP